MSDDKAVDELQRLIEDAKTQRYFCTRCGNLCDRPVCTCNYMAIELPTPKWIKPASALCDEVKSQRVAWQDAHELRELIGKLQRQNEALRAVALSTSKRRVRNEVLAPCWCEDSGTKCVGQVQCSQALAALDRK